MNKFDQATDPNTPPTTLKQLATDEYSYLRRCVAIHPNTPPEILEQLATDEDSWVRCCVAKNPNYQKSTVKVPDLSVTEYEALKELLKNTQNQSLKSLSTKLGVIQ